MHLPHPGRVFIVGQNPRRQKWQNCEICQCRDTAGMMQQLGLFDRGHGCIEHATSRRQGNERASGTIGALAASPRRYRTRRHRRTDRHSENSIGHRRDPAAAAALCLRHGGIDEPQCHAEIRKIHPPEGSRRRIAADRDCDHAVYCKIRHHHRPGNRNHYRSRPVPWHVASAAVR